MNLRPLLYLFRPRPDIHSISMTHFGWDEKKKHPGELSWSSPDYPATLSIQFKNHRAPLPCPLTELDKLRTHYRQQMMDENGGILKVETLSIEGINCLETLVKIPRSSSGMLYVSTITVPLRDCSYVIRLQMAEGDITGIREAVIGQKLLAEHTVTVSDNLITGWVSDPYLSGVTGGSLMNLAEKEEYDEMFPDHPLTQIRKLTRELCESIHFSRRLKKAGKF